MPKKKNAFATYLHVKVPFGWCFPIRWSLFAMKTKGQEENHMYWVSKKAQLRENNIIIVNKCISLLIEFQENLND